MNFITSSSKIDCLSWLEDLQHQTHFPIFHTFPLMSSDRKSGFAWMRLFLQIALNAHVCNSLRSIVRNSIPTSTVCISKFHTNPPVYSQKFSRTVRDRRLAAVRAMTDPAVEAALAPLQASVKEQVLSVILWYCHIKYTHTFGHL